MPQISGKRRPKSRAVSAVRRMGLSSFASVPIPHRVTNLETRPRERRFGERRGQFVHRPASTTSFGLHLAGARITFVGINYVPEPTGIAPYTALFAESLAEAGAEVEVITGVPHYPAWSVPEEYRRGLSWHEEIAGVQVTRLRHWVPRVPNTKGRAVLEASFLAEAVSTVVRRKSDAIIAITPSLAGLAAAVAGRRGRPVGALVQDLTGQAASQSGTTSQGFGSRLARVEYGLLERADLVGVITPDFQAALIEHGVTESKLVPLANCIHVSAFAGTKAEARQKLQWAAGDFLVVYTGSLGRKQGLETAIETARGLAASRQNVRFMIVGDGGELKGLRELADGLANVTFVPPVDAEHYPVVLAAADALLLTERPGVKEMSLPSKLTSYAVAGRPILASVAKGGISERLLINTESAMVSAAGDVSALIQNIKMIVEDAEVRDRYAEHASRLELADLSVGAARQRYLSFARDLLALR
ncbi:MAG: wcaI [Ilumatobacteraceae bacterium]|nr:wcaI [Ilumatobacteraceae bacterium]